jgi:hypothetical protein
MDIVGRFYPLDGTGVNVVTRCDDHSRFCACARIVIRATARPVCDAFTFARRQRGAPNHPHGQRLFPAVGVARPGVLPVPRLGVVGVSTAGQ